MFAYRRSVGQCGLVLLAAVTVSSAARTAIAQEKLIVYPSGEVTWDQMVAASAKLTPLPREIPEPKPPWRYRMLPPKQGVAPPPAVFDFRDAPIRNPTLMRNFQSIIDNNTVIPPDTMGAIGHTKLLTMINSEVRSQSRSGTGLGPVLLEAFWTGASGLSGSPFDPKVVYDAGAQRWYATVDADGFEITSAVWLAVSDGNDPQGSWKFYSFVADSTGNTWADYPGFGYNKNWIAITQNMFTRNEPIDFVGAKMWVIDRATALAGGPLTVTVMPVGFDTAGSLPPPQGEVSGFTLKPCVTADPNEETLWIVDNSAWSDPATYFQLIRISRITGSGPSPVWSVAPGSAYAGTGLFKVVNDHLFGRFEADQKNGPPIDAGDSRLLCAEFRNGRIWTAHIGGFPASLSFDRVASFWYQIDPNGLPNPVVQSGVLEGGAGVHYYYPSLAVNKYDDMCIGFSQSSNAMFPSSAFTGRYGKDPLNALRPVRQLKAGQAKYNKTYGGDDNRWGDYSATAVDPNDEITFWTLQEHATTPSGGFDRWNTWWGEVQITTDCNGNGIPDDVEIAAGTVIDCNHDGLPDVCQSIPDPAITMQPVGANVCPGAQVQFVVEMIGAEPFVCQWYKDGAPVSGATALTYTIAAAEEQHVGAYYAQVRDACQDPNDPNDPPLQSETVNLTLQPGTQITAQPQSVTVPAGAPAAFTVQATGVGTLLYQWRLDGENIGGATAATYSIASALLPDRGVYDCVVSSNCGVRTTQPATLKLTISPAGQPAPVSGSVEQEPVLTLRWSEVVGASGYEVYLGKTGDPPLKTTTTNRVYVPAQLEYNTTYYWRIVAINPDSTAPGPLWSFTTKPPPPPPPPPPQPPGTPSGPSPASGAVNVPVNAALTWAEAERATTYKVLIATNPQMTNAQFEGTTLKPNWTELIFEPSRTYYWRIIASNEAGFVVGPVWSFTTVAPAPDTAQPLQPTTPGEPNETEQTAPPSTANPDTAQPASGLCQNTGLAMILATMFGLWNSRRRT